MEAEEGRVYPHIQERITRVAQNSHPSPFNLMLNFNLATSFSTSTKTASSPHSIM